MGKNYKPYTLVGSRETPNDILVLMAELVYYLCKNGYTARSGSADGCDTCAEDGYKRYVVEFGHNTKLLECYLPWRGFNGRDSKFPPYYIAPKLESYNKAMVIAEETHPAWERCSNGAKGLHTRNVMQVLGMNIDSPSKFLICWAKPKGNDGIAVMGGTNTAVQLAYKHEAEIFNLYYPEFRVRIQNWINSMKGE